MFIHVWNILISFVTSKPYKFYQNYTTFIVLGHICFDIAIYVKGLQICISQRSELTQFNQLLSSQVIN